nr:MAG: major capsid protein [Microviridae sp.]
MAQNIWDATLDVDNNVKQNAFDWSHTNNLTTQIGRLTPVFCDLVPAKTSFRVKPNFGLQFMPMVFPIQTRMRATISWFRYPLRALWKDYKDFVGNFRQGLEEPYVNISVNSLLKDKSIPVTYNTVKDGYTIPSFNNYAASSINECDFIKFGFPSYLKDNITIELTLSLNAALSSSIKFSFNNLTSKIVFADSNNVVRAVVVPKKSYDNALTTTYKADIDLSSVDYSNVYLVFEYKNTGSYSAVYTGNINVNNSIKDSKYSFPSPATVKEVTLGTSPWYNSNGFNQDNQIKLSAYAFRAYEGIYNAFYRDNRNNPYYINGEVQYNQWIPSYDGGVDNNLYELRYANWERDFLTTAVQSPQQGQAPLVGITTYTTTGYQTNSDGTQSEVPVQKVALVDESGKRYAVEFQSNEEGLTGVNYVELENGTTVRSARNLLDLATSGISIPDLRMVNCYQKFLELNMRKGYSYKEIVEGRFDVNVRYADLLLPQFFGGFSRDMNMNAISQTVDQDSTGSGSYREALGSQAGVGYFSGATNHNIECFCDEESIIMGILVVTPLPVYTQLLPKHFTYRGLLDHFNPEFNNIGFQPISYKEVCPIQAYNSDPSSLGGTFGYQRPWYEYCQRYDQAHGLFRTDLSNFLMHRVFDVKPELAQSFLVIDPDQVTDVFSVTETTDKIYGQIRLDITCKLPVARIAIPRLD